ncbi:MAG TPA: ATP-dependent 6-phosphofructokinase [Myxococcota bacterium]|nr:ATP-dependent 6-phosphofructokinase [Myxococcota bacterium]
MTLQPVHPDAEFATGIENLGPCKIANPTHYRRFTTDDQRVLYDKSASDITGKIKAGKTVLSFEEAGPREKIFFEPEATTAAVVTAGGLCPGLNDVTRSIVHELHFNYGVQQIKGIRYGYAGLSPISGWPMIDLTPDLVRRIHDDGGTVLGSSRGPQPVDQMVDTLVREHINILFTIGGDGTLRGALAIQKHIARRRLPIAVVGVPKTIDNDIDLVSRTFGFDTAVGEAVEAIRCAHTEAEGALNGIGMVKLMGRNSGFVAIEAALAEGDVNFVLVPEVPFDLDGPRGFLACLEKRLKARHHAVIVVAEGAGQNLFPDDLGQDASGNRRLGDIGLLLKECIKAHFTGKQIGVSVKYIDPSYMIRSVPANANDCVFCVFLGQNAVHAGMAGKTGLLVGSWHNMYVHVPIASAIARRKCLDPQGNLWRSVLEATGQPESMSLLK